MNHCKSSTSINNHHQSWTIIIKQSSSNNHQLSSIIAQHQPSTSIIKIIDTRSRWNRPHQTSCFSSLPHCRDWPTRLTLVVRVLKNMCVSESACSFCVACKSVWSDSTHTRITQTWEWGRWTQSLIPLSNSLARINSCLLSRRNCFRIAR